MQKDAFDTICQTESFRLPAERGSTITVCNRVIVGNHQLEKNDKLWMENLFVH